jgi:hypothetical protein
LHGNIKIQANALPITRLAAREADKFVLHGGPRNVGPLKTGRFS